MHYIHYILILTEIEHNACSTYLYGRDDKSLLAIKSVMRRALWPLEIQRTQEDFYKSSVVDSLDEQYTACLSGETNHQSNDRWFWNENAVKTGAEVGETDIKPTVRVFQGHTYFGKYLCWNFRNCKNVLAGQKDSKYFSRCASIACVSIREAGFGSRLGHS